MNVKETIQKNYFGKVRPLLDGGFEIIKGKFTRKAVVPDSDSPWIFHLNLNDKTLNCLKWHDTVFKFFGAIPKECFDCYKVVVRPKTVVDLIKLKDIQKNLPEDVQCKCGIEVREYVEAPYGGYFYCRGLEAGLNRLDEVRAMLTDKIDGETYLKRACTEYEVKFGHSNKWVYDPAEAEYSEWIDANFDKQCFFQDVLVPDYIEQSIVSRWIDFAAFIGDQSYLELTDGEPLYEPAIRYERKL